MMTIDQLFSALNLTVAAGGCVLLYFFFRDLWIDRLRDDLFGTRDEMFDYADRCGILNHPGHTQLRDIMNSMIRYAHRISFARLLLSLFFSRFVALPDALNPSARWRDSLATLPYDQRQALENFHMRMWGRVVLFIVNSSPVLRPASMLFGAYLALKKMGDTTMQQCAKLMPGVELIEAQALAARH